jgi:hypothetical protein
MKRTDRVEHPARVVPPLHCLEVHSAATDSHPEGGVGLTVLYPSWLAPPTPFPNTHRLRRPGHSVDGTGLGTV